MYLRVNKQPSREHHRGRRRGARRCCPSCTGVPPGVNIGLTFDQSTYIRQSIESLWHEAVQGATARVPGHPHLPAERASRRSSSPSRSRCRSCCTLIAMYFLGPDAEHLHARAASRSPSAASSTTRSSSWRTSTGTSPSPARTAATAVLDAAREVAMPIFVSTITTIVVFLPTVFLEGQAKLLFIPLTFTISFSLFASFLVSRTVTPLLCLRLLKPAQAREAGGAAVCAIGSCPGARRAVRRPGRACTSERSAGRSAIARSWCWASSSMFLAQPRRSSRSSAASSSRPRTRASSGSSAARARSAPGSRRRRRWSPGSRRSSGRTSSPGSSSRSSSTVGIPGGPLGPLHREHRPPRGAGPGVPGHAGPAEAERRADRRRDPPAASPGEFPGTPHLLQPRRDRQPRAEPRLAESARGRGARATTSTTRQALAREVARVMRDDPGRRRRPDQPRGELPAVRASWSTARRRRPPA